MDHLLGIVWDLDGTLLDTLEDLTGSVNFALRTYGMPERTQQEVRAFLGNGAERLLRLSVPQDTDEDRFKQVLGTFREHYAAHNLDHTAPYTDIMALLNLLHSCGVGMAVVSNKPEFAVDSLRRHFFDTTVEVAIGDAPGLPRKPSPEGTLEALKVLGVGPEQALLVGDSEVDIETARRAGMPCLSVTWGFRDREQLEQAGAERIVSTVAQATEYIRNLL